MQVSWLVVIPTWKGRDASKSFVARLLPTGLNILSVYNGKMKPWGPGKGDIDLQLWEQTFLIYKQWHKAPGYHQG